MNADLSKQNLEFESKIDSLEKILSKSDLLKNSLIEAEKDIDTLNKQINLLKGKIFGMFYNY